MGRIWLNTAHQGALPRAAAEAAQEAIRWKQSPWELTVERFTGVPERLRQALARLVNARPSEIVLANSSSYGLHLLANGFPWRQGDEVLLVRGDFPSTHLPWLGLESRGVRVRFIEPRGEVVSVEDLESHLSPAARVFCTTWVHSFTGHTVDALALGSLCRARGVRFLLSASQGIGARPLDIASTPVDALTSVGFKWLCGPYGTGFCWVRPDLLAELEYNQRYWLAFQDASALEAGTEVLPNPIDLGARRYDLFGTANFFNFIPWTASLELLLAHGIEEIARHDQALVGRLLDGLDTARFSIHSPRDGVGRSTLAFVSHRAGERNRELMEHLRAHGVDVALRRGRLRISPHVYNTRLDIDRALELLQE